MRLVSALFVGLAILPLVANSAAPAFGAAVGDLVISEFMASNSTALADEDGEFSDWLEIHNTGTTAVDLNGWYLTDDATDPTQWTFPAVTLNPDTYLVVFASGKDKTAAELHTNFKLGAGGEYLGLIQPDGVTIEYEYAPAFPPQSTDVSYGIPSDGGFSFFTTSTPGAPNGVSEGLKVAPPVFSVQRGLYDVAFDLVLTPGTPDSVVHYTTDGSEPTAASPEYTDPIPITTTSTVRAKAIFPGWFDSTVETHTYIFIADVLNQPATIPGYPNNDYNVFCGTTAQHDNEMDPSIVTDPLYSGEMDAAMRSIPSMSLVLDPGTIFGADGFYDNDDLIKNASIEVLYPGNPAANEQAETGVESHSWIALKESIRLNFKSEYGDSVFVTNLFKDTAPLNAATATDQQKRIVLRAGSDHSWTRCTSADKTTFTEDQFYRDSQIAMSGIGSHGTFAHLYINGIYWGLYNPVERPDEHFTSEYLGGDSDDWFFTKHGDTVDGDPARYTYLIGALKDKDLTDPTNYAEFQEYLDIDEYIDYLLITWYMQVVDWVDSDPDNNWYYGNRSDAAPEGPTPGQYYAWDGEIAWAIAPWYDGVSESYRGPWVHPAFRDGESGDGEPITELWHAARQNSDFMATFADRVQMHLSAGGALSDANSLARWDTLNTAIYQAILGESARWGDGLDDGVTRTRNNQWQTEVDAIADVLDGSAADFIAALRAEGFYPSFDAPVYSQDGGIIAPGFDLTITNPGGSGTVYYTTDGSDPRGASGAVGATATPYTTPIDLPNTTTVQSRVKVDSTWSAMTSAQFIVPSPLRITEMHYHPADPTPAEIAALPPLPVPDADDFEFIEIQNTGSAAVDLTGVVFTDGIDFTFPAMTLDPGAYVVAVQNQASFEVRYGTGLPVAGEYTPDNLSNGGEQIVLEDAFGVTIHDYTYDDKSPWAETPDGDGPSLEVIDTEADYGEAANWQASVNIGGSPGAAPGPDVTAPSVSVSSPANWSTVAAPVSIEGSASDDVGVTSVVLEIFDRDTSEWWNGSGWQAARTSFVALLDDAGALSSGWSYSFDPPSPASQPYWVTVRAFDAAGNPSPYVYRNFTAFAGDVTAPSVSVSSPANWSTVSSPVSIVGFGV